MEPGSVDNGTTRTDSMALERQRKITIQSAVTSFRWKGYKVKQILEPCLFFTLFAPQEYLSRAYHDAVKYDAVIETTSLKNNEAILTGEIPARRLGEYT